MPMECLLRRFHAMHIASVQSSENFVFIHVIVNSESSCCISTERPTKSINGSGRSLALVCFALHFFLLPMLCVYTLYVLILDDLCFIIGSRVGCRPTTVSITDTRTVECRGLLLECYWKRSFDRRNQRIGLLQILTQNWHVNWSRWPRTFSPRQMNA